MTGWRIGWGLGSKVLMTAMADFLSQTTSNVCSISQKAALAAILGGKNDLIIARKNLKDRKEKFVASLSAIPKIKIHTPDGAFYVWINVFNCFGRLHLKSNLKISNSKELSEILLNHHLIAVVPGSEFGSEGYIRLSFATSQANLDKAATRLAEFVSQLSD
jgi:aspartate aminotransferase